jgi:hypothetical protein
VLFFKGAGRGQMTTRETPRQNIGRVLP